MKRLFLILIASCCAHVPGAWAETTPTEDTVLVSWRDLQLTRSDYEAALAGIPEIDRFTFQLNLRRITELLTALQLNRTLAAEGRKLGLDVDPVIRNEMALAAERVLASRRLEAFEKSLKIPDLTAAAEERYRLKPEEFRDPEQVHASHVLVTAQSRSDEEARARAEEVRRKALAGEDFAGLVKEFSDDPSAKDNQGDLGTFPRGRMVKTFEDAAFALEKPGDISPLVKSPFGYHVIKLHQKLPGSQRSFDQVKAGLIEELKKKYVTMERNRYAEAITTDKSIVLNKEAIANLRLPMPKIPDAPLSTIPKDASAPAPGK
jgi:peptidyl-prolyl cis-trans isomerase C